MWKCVHDTIYPRETGVGAEDGRGWVSFLNLVFICSFNFLPGGMISQRAASKRGDQFFFIFSMKFCVL